jgi:hypothetical protein
MAELEAERIEFQSVTESIDTTTPGGKLVAYWTTTRPGIQFVPVPDALSPPTRETSGSYK